MSDRSVKPLGILESEASRLLADLQTAVDALRRLETDDTDRAASEIQATIDEIRDALGGISA